jgi:predicted GIY-YIG superfamily endonuclease
MEVYLLHFERPLKHARHYLGKTTDRAARLADHLAGKGARILQVCRAKGIRWRCVRVWRRADRKLERRLKQLHRADLCPMCSGPRAHQRGKR